MRGLTRWSHPNDARQGAEALAVLQGYGVDRGLGGDTEHLEQHGRLELRHVAPREERVLRAHRV
jgi:hypothetical protein